MKPGDKVLIAEAPTKDEDPEGYLTWLVGKEGIIIQTYDGPPESGAKAHFKKGHTHVLFQGIHWRDKDGVEYLATTHDFFPDHCVKPV